MGFRNSILGGIGALIRTYIKSPNYVAGTSGWSINKDGSSEFSNALIRGDFQAGSTASGHVTIDATGAKFYDTAGNLRVYIPAQVLSSQQLLTLGTILTNHITVATGYALPSPGPLAAPLLDISANTGNARIYVDGTGGGVLEFSSTNTLTATPLDIRNGPTLMIPWGILTTTPNHSTAVTAGVVTPNELKDGGVGDYTFTAVAGHSYLFHYDARARSSVANTTADLIIRGAQGASPTTASPVIAARSIFLAGAAGAGGTNAPVDSVRACPTEIAAGSWTVAGFYKCTAGGGSVNVDSAQNQPRELYVKDVGVGS